VTKISKTRAAVFMVVVPAVLSCLFSMSAQSATPRISYAAIIVDSPASDPLNVRKSPAITSDVVKTLNNGDAISMTGRCKNIKTGRTFRLLDTLDNAPRVRARHVWCELDGSGDIGTEQWIGWAPGRFLDVKAFRV
jgi:hypothetical protein